MQVELFPMEIGEEEKWEEGKQKGAKKQWKWSRNRLVSLEEVFLGLNS